MKVLRAALKAVIKLFISVYMAWIVYLLLCVAFRIDHTTLPVYVSGLVRLDQVAAFRRGMAALCLSAGAGLAFFVLLMFKERGVRPFILLFSVTLLGGITAFAWQEELYSRAVSGIRINEVGANRELVLEIEQEEAETEGEPETELTDYLEIYNGSDYEIDLEGYSIRKNEKVTLLSDMVISPHDYLVLKADGSGDAGSLEYRIGSNGGVKLSLYSPEGDCLDEVELPELKKNRVYARDKNDQSKWGYAIPTIGRENEALKVGEPVFSVAGGVYDEEFYLDISASDGDIIYYTLDGNDPTVDSDVYTGPILIGSREGEPNKYRSLQNVVPNWKEYDPPQDPVDKCTVVRAMACQEGEPGSASEIITNSYYIGLPQYAEGDVLSLVVDSETFFGEDGYYVSGLEYDEWYLNGKKWDEPLLNFEKRVELEGNIEFFRDGKQLTDQLCGVKIQGNSGRYGPIKRLSVYSREEYSGRRTFDDDVFFDTKTHAILLYRSVTNASFFYDVVTDRDLATLKSMPVRLFIDGEYWGDTYAIEKYNGTYFEQRYHLDRNKVQYLKLGVGGQLFSFIESHDLSTEEAYEELIKIMDPQSYADFLCTNIYLTNMDFTDHSNALIWRTTEDDGSFYGDGRWRWGLYDMDMLNQVMRNETGLNDIPDAQINVFSQSRPCYQPLRERPFYAALRTNESWNRLFVNTFMDMVNTCFTVERMEKKLQEWGFDLAFDNYFFRERPRYAVEHLEEEFGLKTKAELTITASDPAGGKIRVNSITPELTEGSWSGDYYGDYPIELSAMPDNGYRFKCWLDRSDGSVYSESSDIEIQLISGENRFEAVFEEADK